MREIERKVRKKRDTKPVNLSARGIWNRKACDPDEMTSRSIIFRLVSTIEDDR